MIGYSKSKSKPFPCSLSAAVQGHWVCFIRRGEGNPSEMSHQALLAWVGKLGQGLGLGALLGKEAELDPLRGWDSVFPDAGPLFFLFTLESTLKPQWGFLKRSHNWKRVKSDLQTT